MPEVNLSVPYKSQWDQDAHGTANDCGPASAAMILNFYEPGANYTTDDIYKKTAAGSGLITISQMQKALASYGYDSQFKSNVSVDELKEYLNKGIPVIALVKYGSLNSVQDKNYKSGHFFVVVGYRDDGYFVNDPNFRDQFRQDGDHHFYTKAEFEKAWADCYLDKNPINSLLIIPRKVSAPVALPVIPMTRNVTVTPDKGINVRTSPKTSEKNIIKTFVKGTSISVDGYVIGENYAGNDLWWKLRGENNYVWSGATNFIPTPKAADPIVTTPTTPPPITDAGLPANTAEIDSLKIQIDTLKGEIKRLNTNALEIGKQNEQLKIDNENLTKELGKFGDLNFETVKTANESLSTQNAELLRKNKELVTQRDNAYIEAFKGWKLLQLNPGRNKLVAALSVMSQVLSLDATKTAVVGWKPGATLHKVGEEKPAINASDATAADLNPAS